jgi:hypothetical protein
MEPVEASESGDHASSIRIPNFNLFDTMAAAGIYDPTINSSSNINNKINLHHNNQHIYSSNNDYNSSSVPTSNGYWPYSAQSYFPGTTRPYQTSVSDTNHHQLNKIYRIILMELIRICKKWLEIIHQVMNFIHHIMPNTVKVFLFENVDSCFVCVLINDLIFYFQI